MTRSRPSRGVLDHYARREQLVPDRVSSGEVPASPGRLTLRKRNRYERVHDRPQVVASLPGNPRFRERVQPEHSEHGPNFGQSLRGAGGVAGG